MLVCIMACMSGYSGGTAVFYMSMWDKWCGVCIDVNIGYSCETWVLDLLDSVDWWKGELMNWWDELMRWWIELNWIDELNWWIELNW